MATDFQSSYRDLLIIQYNNKEKAQKEIEALTLNFSKIFDLYKSFSTEFDIDTARGDQIDILGRIVGINRRIGVLLPKIQFGFDGDATARGFHNLFDADSGGAPFNDIFEPDYSDLELNDNDYRKFIKYKAIKNLTESYMVSDEKIGIMDAILLMFDYQAKAYDLKNMTLLLEVSTSFEEIFLQAIIKVGLLPQPQAVKWIVQRYDENETFGFDDDTESVGFADLFDAPTNVGYFADIVI